MIPGRTGLSGAFSLGAAETTPLSGVQFVLSTTNSPSTSPNLFGSSVSGRLQTTTNTADADNEGDFIVGAPGYDVTQNATRANAGGAQIVQGGLITVPIPISNTVTVQIGVGQAVRSLQHQRHDARQPADLCLRLARPRHPHFMPVTDINPATVTVNGVAFPDATIAARPQYRTTT